MIYSMTNLEMSIQKLYQNLSIFDPSQINMMDIAEKLDIKLYFANTGSIGIDNKGKFSVIIDENLSAEQQWEDFGHEVGHLRLHAGNQHIMTTGFRMLQESQANNFAMHFCVPTFMLLKYELANVLNLNDGTAFVEKTFNVTAKFAADRLIHFQYQLLLSKSDHEFRKQMDALYPKTNPENYSIETKNLLKKLNRQVTQKQVKGAAV